MKILVFYTPRSKSTAVHDALAKKFDLTPMGDIVTLSRIKNKNFNEYPEIIEKINCTDNIIVKLNGNDFVDVPNQKILGLYETIDFGKFNKIIFVTRDNLAQAIASYAYMDPANKQSWHKPRGEVRTGKTYEIAIEKVYHMIRGYIAYNQIKQYIAQLSLAVDLHDYEYNTVESSLLNNFGITTDSIDIETNNYDYEILASNYADVKKLVPMLYTSMMNGNMWEL